MDKQRRIDEIRNHINALAKEHKVGTAMVLIDEGVYDVLHNIASPAHALKCCAGLSQAFCKQTPGYYDMLGDVGAAVMAGIDVKVVTSVEELGRAMGMNDEQVSDFVRGGEEKH